MPLKAVLYLDAEGRGRYASEMQKLANSTSELTNDERKALTNHLSEKGERALTAQLQINRATLSRALAGQRMMRATATVIRAWLKRAGQEADGGRFLANLK